MCDNGGIVSGMTQHITPPVSSDPTRLRVSGVAGIVASIPQILGFVPNDSMAMLCLTLPHGHVGPVMRIDLPDLAEDMNIDQAIHCADRYADTVVLAFYHDGPRPSAINRMRRRFRQAGIP